MKISRLTTTRLFTGLLAAVALLAAAGCRSTREGIADRVKEKSYFTPVNFNGEARLPVTLRRVQIGRAHV